MDLDPPWRVQMLRDDSDDGYQITVVLGGVKTTLPALEAHKLGSALQVAANTVFNRNVTLEL